MNSQSSPDHPEQDSWLSLVQGQVQSLRFGVVQIVVHDSQVVQIERTEKVRFDNGGRTFSASRRGPGTTTDTLEI